MWNIGWAPNNVSKWQMGFNSAFKGLKVKFDIRVFFENQKNSIFINTGQEKRVFYIKTIIRH